MPLKNYVGISRDHSASIRSQGLTRGAMQDYNTLVSTMLEESRVNDQDTIVSVVKNGVGRPGVVEREIVNCNVTRLQQLQSYIADGNSTPLFDSVGELIEILESVPDRDDPSVAFLVLVITDGQENSSKRWSATRLASKIRELQGTDKWTFVFRVPRGYTRELTRLGIPEGNIQEWDTTSARGLETSTVQTRQAFSGYYQARSKGATSTQKFYTDLSMVSPTTLKQAAVDISNQVVFHPVHQDGRIDDFVTKIYGRYVPGQALYQLTKTEKAVQDHKTIMILDRQSGHVYSGPAARQLLGLPTVGSVKVAPGNHAQYEVFVQSTSSNRKLLAGTKVLYWKTFAKA